MNETHIGGVKQAVKAIIGSLPDDVTWDEVQYRLYVRQQIDAGLADSDAGRLIDTDELHKLLFKLRRQPYVLLHQSNP